MVKKKLDGINLEKIYYQKLIKDLLIFVKMEKMHIYKNFNKKNKEWK